MITKEKTSKYLYDVTGSRINIRAIPENEIRQLPLYLRKNLFIGQILNTEVVIVETPKKNMITPAQFKLRTELISKILKRHVVFILDEVESYTRNRLIQMNVAFIVPGKQMFVPFLFIDLKEFKTSYANEIEKLFPAAQCLLFYYLLGNEVQYCNFKTIAGKINYGNMTVTRAAILLAELKLCQISGSKEKRINFNSDKKNLWEESQKYLLHPVTKIVYLDNVIESKNFYTTGVNALSYYTNMAAVQKKSYAIYNADYKSTVEKQLIHPMRTSSAEILVEVWKYNPGILTKNSFVDPLSLALILQEQDDERVSGEIEIMLSALW